MSEENELKPVIVTHLDLKLSSMPVGDAYIVVTAHEYRNPKGHSPTFLIPLVEAEFVLSYVATLREHAKTIEETFFNQENQNGLIIPD